MKLLVVEDEEKIAASLQKGLTAEGYVVDVAYDGDQAEAMLSADGYDLVLLDWMIPGTSDGPGLTRQWRTEHKQMPILMLTARSAIGDRVVGLDAGADDYLPKPFSFDELLARVRALLRRPQEHNGNVLESGGLQMDGSACIPGSGADVIKVKLLAKTKYWIMSGLMKSVYNITLSKLSSLTSAKKLAIA